MVKSKTGGIERGQTISFRVPSDTPDYLLKHLQRLKEEEKRNFSSKIAEYVLQGVGNSYQRKRESITVPLPNKLSKVQRDWMKHEHSEALMGTILYHLLSDPVRATSLLGTLNSNAANIDDALYLQEKSDQDESQTYNEENSAFEPKEDDLDTFDINKLKNQGEESEEPKEELDDMLGDFLAKMNK